MNIWRIIETAVELTLISAGLIFLVLWLGGGFGE